MTETKQYEWISLRAFGTKIPDAATLVQVLDCMRETGFEPSHYGAVDGGVRLPFTPEAFADDSEAIYERGVLYFQCSSSIKGEIELGRRPRFTLSMRKDRVVPRAIERWLALSSRLPNLLRPDFMVFGFGPLNPQDSRRRSTWTTGEERDRLLIAHQSYPRPQDYRRHGPLGLGFRTYLGPHLAGLFDAEVLRATPGAVTEFDSGGVQIDVTDDLVGTEFLDLVRAWKRCSEHLESSSVFAVPSIDETRKRIRFTQRSERYVPLPKENP